ncbi:flagellar protein FlaG [Marinitoga litoralis]|jgi:flagellar protein FlaG|uniref:flagellar protein FlaG n=1 Tax=Marinitoga litoralis TaxID=570855 RepID=UPI001960CFE3|nr:flagellar protein FlaG [Marinitoga litoralis]MBM7560040.1 flagellar protein FlaG [Marinitoga litoralis]
MGDLNRISGDFTNFLDSLSKDSSNKNPVKAADSTEKYKGSNANFNQPIDNQKLSKTIEEKLNNLKEIFKGEVRFEVDNDIDMIIVKIVDKNSKKIIRQIPSETAVKMAEMLDKLEGIFLDTRA